MSEKLLTDSKWIDIIPPLQPQNDVLVPLLIISLCAILLTYCSYLIYRTRPKQKLLRSIRYLLNKTHRTNTDADCRTALQTLYCILFSIPEKHAADFKHNNHDYYDKLTRCCFSAYAPNKETTLDLIQQALRLVKK